MGMFREVLEEYTKRKIAKEHWRTCRQQEYRNDLANNLREIRQFWDAWKDVAEVLLIKEKWKMEYMDSLWKGRKSTKDTTEQLVYSKPWDDSDLNKFEWSDQQAIAEILIEKWYIAVLTENIDRFEWLNYKRLVEKLVEKGEYWCKKLMECVDKFQWVDYNKIAERLIQAWNPWLVIEHFEKFKWLNNEVINKCIKARFKYDDKYEAFEQFLKKFEWKLDYCVAENLVKNWMSRLVYSYLGKFEWLDCKNFIELLIRNGDREFLSQYIKRFEWKLDYEVSEGLIDNGLSEVVIQNLNKFKWLDKKIAEGLIEEWYSEHVFTNLDKFSLHDADYKEIINKSLELGMRQSVNRNLSNLERWLDEKIVSRLIFQGENSSRTHGWWNLQSIIQKNQIKINHTKILGILIKSGYRTINSYLKEFECCNKDMAEMLIRENHTENVVKNLELFEWLDKEIGEKLAKAGYWDIVEKYPENFGI